MGVAGGWLLRCLVGGGAFGFRKTQFSPRFTRVLLRCLLSGRRESFIGQGEPDTRLAVVTFRARTVHTPEFCKEWVLRDGVYFYTKQGRHRQCWKLGFDPRFEHHGSSHMSTP